MSSVITVLFLFRFEENLVGAVKAAMFIVNTHRRILLAKFSAAAGMSFGMLFCHPVNNSDWQIAFLADEGVLWHISYVGIIWSDRHWWCVSAD